MGKRRNWGQEGSTYVWVFNTGRGLSVCIRLPHNFVILYDLGCSDDFKPTDFVRDNVLPHLDYYQPPPDKADESKKKYKIAQVVLSHPHADHISEIAAIDTPENERRYPLEPCLITCPNDKNKEQSKEERVRFNRVEHDESQKELLDRYRKAYEKRQLPLRTITSSTLRNYPNVEYGLYYLKPERCARLHPKDDQDYTNALSIVLYLRHGKQNILIPGDITPDAMTAVLTNDSSLEKRYTWFDKTPTGISGNPHKVTGNQPGLSEVLKQEGLSVLVTPHHGLESGFCEDLFKCMKGGKPEINVISEKRSSGDGHGQVDARYQSNNGAVGHDVDVEGKNENRYSISTRDGHHILIVFQGTGEKFEINMRKDPTELLNEALALEKAD